MKKSILLLLSTLACGTAFANTYVDMKTSMGNIEIELNDAQAPISTKNFLNYVKSNFYANTIFHRVIPGFMIQGGGFEQNFSEKQTAAPIKNESYNGLSNVRGTLAMARTSDPDSATAQFFINTVDNPNLNKSMYNDGYAVFGKVVKGMDIVDKISKVETTDKGMYQNVPIKPIFIESIKVENKKQL
ncbi:hypothetical protein P256_02442 [Acinetobacter nectaris CIP 110549]|uniref:Peptidyl-prolyl cis-trans isomerase n=1 Tax=Acinetobacter nectaris CIP 110549 TaxID=1392540 RepID=V2UML5_9GAMM|nr:peptidylprolyl isomerase [Acinetobacter nectaris]ESK36649.1 hypothetical protein P256_02442 [Acinetobacter nectaris CIP 110549]